MEDTTFEVRRVIGENIREKRKQLRLTQAEFTERAGISVQSLSSFENGMQFARMDTYCIIADTLGISIFDLFRVPTESLDDEIDAVLGRLLFGCDTGKRMTLLNILRSMEMLIQDTKTR
jgi:Predicted transcriptional regulators